MLFLVYIGGGSFNGLTNKLSSYDMHFVVYLLDNIYLSIGQCTQQLLQ
jgi:hypothetical protein